MKHSYFLTAFALMALMLSSCDNDDKSPESAAVTFLAKTESTWSAGDAVSILNGTDNLMYVAAEDGSKTELTGETKLMTPVADVYAAYPYNPDYTRNEMSLQLEFPSVQTPSVNNTDPHAYITAAYSDKVTEHTELQFFMVPSFFKFSVSADDKISKVELSGAADEYLAGTASVTIYDSPTIKAVNGLNKVLFSSPDILDGTYVVAVLPAVLQEGLTVTFTNTLGNTVTKKVIAKDENGLYSALIFKRGLINTDSIIFENLFDYEPENPDPGPDPGPEPEPEPEPDPEYVYETDTENESYIITNIPNELWK